MMNNKWRLPHPATMFLLLTLAVIVLSWIFDIYGLSVFQPQTGEEIRVQSLLSPEGVRWLLRHVVTNFTGFAPLGLVIVAMFGIGVAQHSGFIDACIRSGARHKHNPWRMVILVIFFCLGVRLIVKAIKNERVNEHREENLGFKRFWRMAAVTSIYTLLTGIAFGFLETNLMVILIMIVCLTIAVVIMGTYTGYHFGFEHKRKAYIGGTILLWIAGFDVVFRYLMK